MQMVHTKSEAMILPVNFLIKAEGYAKKMA